MDDDDDTPTVGNSNHKEDGVQEEDSQMKKMLHYICGVNEKATEEAKAEEGPKLSPEEEAATAAKFLDESKFWRRFVNSNAVLLMTIAVFMWAFYA
jgi:sodium/glucose cotransporter 1/sodium/glucose cotransporter 9